MIMSQNEYAYDMIHPFTVTLWYLLALRLIV